MPRSRRVARVPASPRGAGAVWPDLDPRRAADVVERVEFESVWFAAELILLAVGTLAGIGDDERE